MAEPEVLVPLEAASPSPITLSASSCSSFRAPPTPLPKEAFIYSIECLASRARAASGRPAAVRSILWPLWPGLSGALGREEVPCHVVSW